MVDVQGEVVERPWPGEGFVAPVPPAVEPLQLGAKSFFVSHRFLSRTYVDLNDIDPASP